jgi:hypothetical protein
VVLPPSIPGLALLSRFIELVAPRE